MIIPTKPRRSRVPLLLYILVTVALAAAAWHGGRWSLLAAQAEVAKVVYRVVSPTPTVARERFNLTES